MRFMFSSSLNKSAGRAIIKLSDCLFVWFQSPPPCLVRLLTSRPPPQLNAHSVGPTSVFELAPSPVLGPGLKHNTPSITPPPSPSPDRTERAAEAEAAAQNQQLSDPVSCTLAPPEPAPGPGCLVWHAGRVHVLLDVLQRKHDPEQAEQAGFCLFGLSAVPQSLHVDGVSTKRHEGKVKLCLR